MVIAAAPPSFSVALRPRVVASIRRRPRVVARARAWGVTDVPFADLDELLVLAGYRVEGTPDAQRRAAAARRAGPHRRPGVADRARSGCCPGCWPRSAGAASPAGHRGTLEELVGAALAGHPVVPDRAPADPRRRQHRARRRRTGRSSRRAGGCRPPRSSVDPRTLDETPAPTIDQRLRGAGHPARRRPCRRCRRRRPRPRPRPRPSRLPVHRRRRTQGDHRAPSATTATASPPACRDLAAWRWSPLREPEQSTRRSRRAPAEAVTASAPVRSERGGQVERRGGAAGPAPGASGFDDRSSRAESSERARHALRSGPVALLQERGDALLGVGGRRRRRPSPGRRTRRPWPGRGRPGRRTSACRAPWSSTEPRVARRIRSSTASSSSASGTARLIRPQSAAVAASMASPVKAISSARLRPMLRATATSGVWQNSPPLPPGMANPARLGGDGQVARGDELAPGGGGQRVHLGAHRLRHRLHDVHHPRAHVEHVAGLVERGAGHVAEVVPGREHRAVGGQHDAEGVGRADRLERGGELLHHVEGEGVALLRPVEGDGRDVPVPLDDEVLVRGGVHPASVARSVYAPAHGGQPATSIRELAEQHWNGEGDLVHAHHPVQPVLGRAAEEIAPGILTMISIASVNAIDTGDGLAMLDTGGQFDADTSTTRSAAGARTRRCASAVYSHHHVDHVFGTRRFEAEATEQGWPQPVVYAHEDLPDQLPPLRAHARLEHGHQPAPVRPTDRRLRLARRTTATRTSPTATTSRSARATSTFELHHARGETDDATWTWVPELRRPPPRRPVHLGRAQRRQPAEGAALRQRLGRRPAGDGRVRRRDHAVRARPADLRCRPHPPGPHRHRRAARLDRGPDAGADEPGRDRSTGCCTRSRCPSTCASCRTCSPSTTTRSSSSATCGAATAAGTTASPTTSCRRPAPSRPGSG